jgi:putative PIN family toxin of toxin-antitoxin system
MPRGQAVPRRKDRIPIVLDTNVLVANYRGHRPDSVNARVVALWRAQRRLQLIVCQEIIDEYLGVLGSLGLSESRLKLLSDQLRTHRTVTHVRPGARNKLSRDPDDDLFLATAQAGSAKFLVTHDHDLLEIPQSRRRSLKFKILTPTDFLNEINELDSPTIAPRRS